MSKKSLHYILSQTISEKHHWKIIIYNAWDTIIGSLKDKVILEKITHDSLVLLVCHPSWAQELFVLVPMIKKKVNALLRNNKIQHVRFKIADFSSRKRMVSRDSARKTQTSEFGQQQALRYLSRKEVFCLRNVKKEGLRESLELYAFRCKALKKKKES